MGLVIEGASLAGQFGSATTTEALAVVNVGESDGLMLHSLKVLAPHYLCHDDELSPSGSGTEATPKSHPPHERIMLSVRIGPNTNNLVDCLAKGPGGSTHAPWMYQTTTPYCVRDNTGGTPGNLWDSSNQGTASERVFKYASALNAADSGSWGAIYATAPLMYDLSNYNHTIPNYPNPYTYSYNGALPAGNWQDEGSAVDRNGPAFWTDLPLHTDTVSVLYVDEGDQLWLKLVINDTSGLYLPSNVSIQTPLDTTTVFFIAEVGPRS